MSQLFASGGQSIRASASASVLPMNIQGRFPLGLTGWISLTIRTFVSKVMFLLFKTLFRFDTAFLLRSKRLLISWLQSRCALILEPKKMKSGTVTTFSHLFASRPGLVHMKVVTESPRATKSNTSVQLLFNLPLPHCFYCSCLSMQITR